MAIRLKNLDLNSTGLKHHSHLSLGDVTATRQYHIFIAPMDCTIDYVDIVSNEANPPATTTASTTNLSATLQVAQTSAVMTSRGTSATETTTNSISANFSWRLTPSANNSLSVGTPVEILFTVGGSGTISGVFVDVSYTPRKHGSTK